jgi:hypothetical protein
MDYIDKLATNRHGHISLEPGCFTLSIGSWLKWPPWLKQLPWLVCPWAPSRIRVKFHRLSYNIDELSCNIDDAWLHMSDGNYLLRETSLCISCQIQKLLLDSACIFK